MSGAGCITHEIQLRQAREARKGSDGKVCECVGALHTRGDDEEDAMAVRSVLMRHVAGGALHVAHNDSETRAQHAREAGTSVS